MYCHIEGCNHRRKARSKTNARSLSWETLEICPCCALILFPDGYKPENGRNIFFHHSNNCSKLIREELEKLNIQNRRELAKQSKIQDSPIETKTSQIRRSNYG